LASGGAGILAWLLWYPMRHSAPFLDDYLFLALGVHVDSPWSLLFGDVTGSFFFRPFVMFLWAVSVRAFGVDGPAQYALNMALHAANGLLLLVLARRYGARAGSAAFAAVFFVVHPTTFSAAAWLSDRFDLVALLFGLVALIMLDAFLEGRRRVALAAALGSLVLALLSKEIAYAMVPTGFAMAAKHWCCGMDTGSRRRALAAMLGILACTAICLCVRVLILRPVAATMFLDRGIASLWNGFIKFFRYLPGFIVVRHGGLSAMFAQCMLVIVPVALVAGARRLELRALVPAASCAGAGVLLIVGCAAAQAPVTHASPLQPYAPSVFRFISLADSRFYYVAFAGVALVGAAAGEALLRITASHRMARAALAAAITIAAIGMTAQSRGIAREWSAFVNGGDAPLLAAAVQAVRSLPAATPGCKIFLLDLPDPDDSLESMLDVAVKQALPRGDPRAACFIQSEHSPWYYLLEATQLPPGAESPLNEILFAGKPYPPLRVANLEYYYLKAVNTPAIIAAPDASFYAWNGQRFANVTALVRSGKRIVKFYDNRRPF